MRVKYSEDVDALYITLKDADIVESDEVSDGVIVDYDDDNNIVGIEILWASEKKDIVRLIIQTIHSQTKDIPSEVIEHEIEEAIRKIRIRKQYAKSGF